MAQGAEAARAERRKPLAMAVMVGCMVAEAVVAVHQEILSRPELAATAARGSSL